MNYTHLLEKKEIRASVPCRVDLGGTLDISTFYLPLAHLKPASFNIALDMRTHVTLSTWTKGRIRISSKGFASAEFDRDTVRFDHPMGLMFAVARYFDADGIHIQINSTSPPKSALGGSSAAAVAIIAAFYAVLGEPINPKKIVWLAHYIESSVAGVPCGVQDHAAAAFGGVNLWEWQMGETGPEFERIPVFENTQDLVDFNDQILVAYCGIPHVSKDINKQWVDAFIRGETTAIFEKIVEITKEFYRAVKTKNFSLAGELMAQETRLRLEMTPEVLDNTGKKLFERAVALNCGARFTGAGGGGCLWAIGERDKILDLALAWKKLLEPVPDAKLLDTGIDTNGILI
ncbi:MAG: galactokinase [Proteobacteria bacterium]|nr:galactokinase [Desulfobacula sp.]MBU3952791.1 galactokinase [Pseudomonadota bacterium]MBU4129365.1 galactokinase [Pseudomonadota bacterium]